MALIYSEKVGMLAAFAAQGLSLYQRDGEWVTDGDEERVQEYIDRFETPKAYWLDPINAIAARRLAVVKEGVPIEEVESWSEQKAEALAGGGPLTQAIASIRGCPHDYLLSKILEKSAACAAYTGAVIGYRQHLEDLISAGMTEVYWDEAVI